MRKKNKKKCPFVMQKREKMPPTLHLQVVQSKVVFDLHPSFLFRSWGLDPALPLEIIGIMSNWAERK